MDVFSTVNSKLEENTVREHITGPVVKCMKATSKTISAPARALSTTQMAKYLSAHGKRERSTVRGTICGQMAPSIT